MPITITAFERSPDGGRGLARDTRVRWALEEVGQPYKVRLVSFRAMKEPAHRALHPFGQIPTYEEGDLVLFETGGDRVPYCRAPCGPAAEPTRLDASSEFLIRFMGPDPSEIPAEAREPRSLRPCGVPGQTVRYFATQARLSVALAPSRASQI
jgi:Glutathione S-transferase, N-terminal domain